MASKLFGKLFVGGLTWATDENGLRGAFSQFGEMAEVKVVRDRVTNRSRGFGFVAYADKAAAEKAREGMDGKDLDGRAIRVDWATEKQHGGAKGT